MGYANLSLVTFLVIVTGCAEEPAAPQQSYADYVLHRSIPANEAERGRECSWIRGEIAKLQNIGTGAVQDELMYSGAPGYMTHSYLLLHRVQIQDAVRNDIAVLNTHADYIHCSAEFYDTPSTNKEGGFAQCLIRCRQDSDNTKNQCLDACK